MNRTGQIPHDLYKRMHTRLSSQGTHLRDEMDQYMKDHPELEKSRQDDIGRALALAERAALEDALAKGLISEDSFSLIRKEVDIRIENQAEAYQGDESAQNT